MAVVQDIQHQILEEVEMVDHNPTMVPTDNSMEEVAVAVLLKMEHLMQEVTVVI